MTEEQIRVPEIHCDHCKMSIEGAVAALPGVDAVTVDVPAGRVDVRFDPGSTNRGDIEAAIEAQGYEVPR